MFDFISQQVRLFDEQQRRDMENHLRVTSANHTTMVDAVNLRERGESLESFRDRVNADFAQHAEESSVRFETRRAQMDAEFEMHRARVSRNFNEARVQMDAEFAGRRAQMNALLISMGSNIRFKV